MRKTFRIVSVREQRVPSGVYEVIGLQEEKPPEGAQQGFISQLKEQKVPEDMQHQLAPIFSMVEMMAGVGMTSDLALTPEEFKSLGSPNVGHVLTLDVELFKE